MADEYVYRGQDVSYLGFLETQLRDMQGVATLAYELIQNADDVRGPAGQPASSRITFDVREDALLVENDGVFRPVDFERLQTIAGGGKRAEPGTTGAFGLGFLAVYQVTDAPEIASGGRHWTIRPEAPPKERIQERPAETTGTRLRLPWAFDPESEVRRALRLPAVGRQGLDELAHDLAQAVQRAALFLRQLQVLEVKREGQLVRRIERAVIETAGEPGRRLRLRDEGGESATWLLFDGTFAAAELAARYPGQIEDGRSDRVQLALPLVPLQRQGRLYAGLPTDTKTPLPFHANADFYPTSDRKRIHFDGGYQAAWNEAALRAAAGVLAGHLDALRQKLAPPAFWQLLQQCRYTHTTAAQGELPAIFSVFWQALVPLFQELSLLYTVREKWVLPAQGRVPEMVPEEPALTLLEALQIPLAHPALAPFFELMRTPAVGVPPLALEDVVEALVREGLVRTTPLHEAPSFLASVEQLQVLWRLLERLTEPYPPPEARAQERQLLNRVALVLTEGMTLERPPRVFRGSEEARALFPDVAWVHPLVPERQCPGRLVEEFGVRQAVAWLAERPVDQLEEAWRMGRLDVPRLFRWFESQQIEIFADDPALQREIRRLPLCPIAGELRPLAELYIPGGFEDPLGVANTVPLEAVGGRRHFLEDLGVEALSFDRYVRHELPRALGQRPDLPSDGRHRLLRLLAERLGELRDDEALREQLSRLPLIPCLDGSFRPGREVYAARQARDLLGEETHVAEPPPTEAREALYRWLGVRHTPTPADLVRRLVQLGQQAAEATRPPAAETVAAVKACWRQLQRYLEEGRLDPDVLARLRGKRVIPAGPQRLARPDEVFLADAPDLAARFPELDAHLLSPERESAPAWALAGVRPLSEAVTTEIVTPGGTEAAPAVRERLAGRLSLLLRIARAEGATDAGRAFLEALRVVAAEPLHVQVRLAVGDAVQRSAPEAAKAVLDREEGVLYVEGDEHPPWLAIAREVARALSGRQTPGGMALAIKEVLVAESAAAAGEMLDELGYPE
ncbi:MAG: hypothetical protein R3248_04405 [Candidatus Promineifilaceae bacterium]|nr:hypothetical protein [Candidatus Promineifilaceae bacterium]